MRKSLGPKSLVYGEPVLIIATYDENKKANAMNAAWGGVSDTNEIGICLSEDHKTTKNILKQKAFTCMCALMMVRPPKAASVSKNARKPSTRFARMSSLSLPLAVPSA